MDRRRHRTYRWKARAIIVNVRRAWRWDPSIRSWYCTILCLISCRGFVCAVRDRDTLIRPTRIRRPWSACPWRTKESRSCQGNIRMQRHLGSRKCRPNVTKSCRRYWRASRWKTLLTRPRTDVTSVRKLRAYQPTLSLTIPPHMRVLRNIPRRRRKRKSSLLYRNGWNSPSRWTRALTAKEYARIRKFRTLVLMIRTPTNRL